MSFNTFSTVTNFHLLLFTRHQPWMVKLLTWKIHNTIKLKIINDIYCRPLQWFLHKNSAELCILFTFLGILLADVNVAITVNANSSFPWLHYIVVCSLGLSLNFFIRPMVILNEMVSDNFWPGCISKFFQLIALQPDFYLYLQAWQQMLSTYESRRCSSNISSWQTM